MPNEKLIPLSEAVSHENDRIDWQLALPEYVPTHTIGINIPRLGRLARLGGFDHLHIVDLKGDVTESLPTIVGSDGRGNAVAGLKAVQKKAPLQQSASAPRTTQKDSDYLWSCGVVGINVPELTDTLSRKGGLRNAVAWSDMVDIALKDGIKEVTLDNLVHNQRTLDKAAPVVVPAVYYAVTSLQGVDNDIGNVMLLSLMYQLGFNPTMNRIFKKLPFSEYRWSAVPGISLDRVLAVSGLASVNRLAKSID